MIAAPATENMSDHIVRQVLLLLSIFALSNASQFPSAGDFFQSDGHMRTSQNLLGMRHMPVW